MSGASVSSLHGRLDRWLQRSNPASHRALYHRGARYVSFVLNRGVRQSEGDLVMPYLSHDVWYPHETVNLSPFAVWREPGQLENAPKSAFRALHILELMVNAGKPLRAKEIAVPLSLSPSSANQLLKTMVDWAYLIFDPITKRYFPSPRIAKLGFTLSDSYFAPGAIEKLMRALEQSLRRSITLSASQGSFMQIMDILWTEHRRRDEVASAGQIVPVGLHVPLFGSCTGAAWLSCQSEETIRASVQLCRRELGRQASEVGLILEQMRRFKAQGYAFGGMSTDDGSRHLAVPLPPTSNGIVLVLCVSGLSQEMEEQREEIARIIKCTVHDYLVAGTTQRTFTE